MFFMSFKKFYINLNFMKIKKNYLFNKKNLQLIWFFLLQFIKFGIVGLSNTLISLGIYYFLVYAGLHYLTANVAGFVVSVCNAYFWNSKFVFKNTEPPVGDKNKKTRRFSVTFVKTFAMYGSTFALGSLLLFIMVDILGVSEWIAPLLNLCVTVPINFLMSKFWVFK